MYIESETTDPSKAPVVVWSNGGPGAPSLYGLMIELGPLLLTPDGKLVPNEFSWSKTSNLLIIDAPAPVGYSYCEPSGPSGSFQSCGDWNDDSTATFNRLAVEGFLKKFPSLIKNDWYFTGESYAGIYIPTLVRELLLHGPKDLKIKGMALGNACVGTDVLCFADGDYWWRAVFLRGHAQISDASYEKFDSECGENLRKGYATEDCKKKYAVLEKQAGFFYEYDVYSECYYDGDFSPPTPSPSARALRFMQKSKRVASTIGGSDFCGGDVALQKWVDDPKVRRALNVPQVSVFYAADNGVGFKYDFTEKDLTPFYRKLVQEKKIRVMIYSGDADVSVNTFASQNWTSKMGFKETEAWRPWTVDGRRAVAGYVTRYEKGLFDFVTIRGSGHMTPEFKPKASFEMLQQFLKNRPLKKYVENAKPPHPVAVKDLGSSSEKQLNSDEANRLRPVVA